MLSVEARQFALGFRVAAGANDSFAFCFRHPEKVSQPIEVGPDRYGFELGGHVSNVAGDVKRIVGSSPRSRRNALSGSPIPGFVSREAYFVGHLIKLSHSAERGRRLRSPRSQENDRPRHAGRDDFGWSAPLGVDRLGSRN